MFVELPVIPHPDRPEVQNMFVNPDNVFFIGEGRVPTPIVEPGPERKPVYRKGTLLGSAGGGGLIIDRLVEEVIAMFNLAGHKCYTAAYETDGKAVKGQKEDGGNGKTKSTKKNKGRVRKSTGDGK